ncbi:MAG: Trk system potassium transporter TrkA [Chlamydiales bacterium]|nr:Trk system potassium transporter TrkA [Chlamydiales bacterium]
MNIVIVGAGDVGMYIAATLSKDQHNVILVDRDAKRLEQASWQMDVATRLGSATDWELLDELMELSPDVFIAVTENDETNLVASSIAKNLGYPKTMARLRDTRYFNRTRLDFGRLFDVDNLIGPELLVAHDILKYILQPGSLAVEHFAHGAVQLRTIAIPARWNHGDKTLSQLSLPPGVMVGLIRRFHADISSQARSGSYQIIFPHGTDRILPEDEVTFIGETDAIAAIPEFFQAAEPTVDSVVIIGGSLTAVNLARIVKRRNISVRIIEPDYNRCRQLSDLLPDCTIINQRGTDIDFLRGERIGASDILVATSDSDEVNILTAVLGQQVGCPNNIVLLTSSSYMEVVARLGIPYVVSPRVSAANAILSFTLAGRVSSMVSLYDNQAEIVEVQVSMRSKVAGIPLSELGPLLPKDFLIAMIQNRGRIMIANGNRIISPGDSIIVITHPQHLKQLEKIF